MAVQGGIERTRADGETVRAVSRKPAGAECWVEIRADRGRDLYRGSRATQQPGRERAHQGGRGSGRAGENPAQACPEPAEGLAQKGTDARWTKKNGQDICGFKDHVNVDCDTKLITAWKTPRRRCTTVKFWKPYYAVRERAEHVFGTMTNDMRGICIRTIGSARAHVQIGLMNLTCNIRRVAVLIRKKRRGFDRIIAPAAR